MSEAAGKSGNGSKSTPAMEANKEYAAIYLDNYIDCLHDLPNDIQRNMSRMQELNVDYAGKKVARIRFFMFLRL